MIPLLLSIPVPDDLGEKLWANSPLTYLLVAAIIALTLALGAVFTFYRQSQSAYMKFVADQIAERRDDAIENLKVLGSLSHVLERLSEKTEHGVNTINANIASAAEATRAHVTSKIESLQARLVK